MRDQVLCASLCENRVNLFTCIPPFDSHDHKGTAIMPTLQLGKPRIRGVQQNPDSRVGTSPESDACAACFTTELSLLE